MLHRSLSRQSLVIVFALVIGASLLWSLSDAPAPTETSGLPAIANERDEDLPRSGVLRSRANTNTPETRPKPAMTRTPGELVRGRVIDALSQHPIYGVIVRDAATENMVETDGGGQFAIQCAVPATGGSLQFKHPDYTRCTEAIDSREVGPQGVEGLVVVLWPRSSAATLLGKIENDRGRPLREATLRMTPLRPHGRSSIAETIVIHGADCIDAVGRFTISDLPPANYRIEITCPGHAEHTRGSVEIPPGSQTQLGTIRLTPVASAEIHGQVTNNGRPCNGVKIIVWITVYDSVTTRSTEDGSYSISQLPPGERRVEAHWHGVRHARTVTCSPGARVQHDVRFTTGGVFVGGQVLIGKEPAKGVEVYCTPPGEYHRGALHWEARTDARGRFRIEHLPGGPVYLSISATTPYQTKEYESVAVGRVDHRFTLEPPLSMIEVVGTVRDPTGKAIAGAVVTTQQLPPLHRRTKTGADGRYRMKVQLERDTSFTLSAHHYGYIGGRQFLSQSQAGAAKTVVDFELQPLSMTGIVAGRVIDASGQAVPKARVFVAARSAKNQAIWRVETDSRGTFFQRGIPQGKVHIAIAHGDFEPATREENLSTGGRIDVEFQLLRHRRLSQPIVVRLQNGALAHGAEVTAWERGQFVADGVTDNGTCTLKGLPAKPISVSCELNGYPRHTTDRGPARAAPRPLEIELQRGTCAVHGVIADATNTPRSGVELILRRVSTAKTRIEVISNSKSGGKYRFEKLPPGRYEIEYYPGPTRKAVTLGGSEVRLNLRLQ